MFPSFLFCLLAVVSSTEYHRLSDDIQLSVHDKRNVSASVSLRASPASASRRRSHRVDDVVLCSAAFYNGGPEGKCQVAEEHCASIMGPVLNWLVLPACAHGLAQFIGWALFPLGFLVFLYTLTHVADVFFCATLDCLGEMLHMPPNVVGVTLMAFGNGANDISAMLVSIAAQRGGALGLGDPLGGGVFASTVILAAVIVVAPSEALRCVPRRPFLRDAMFYFFALPLLWAVLRDGIVQRWEGAVLIGYYAVYVAIVIVGRRFFEPMPVITSDDSAAVACRLEATDSTDVGGGKRAADRPSVPDTCTGYGAVAVTDPVSRRADSGDAGASTEASSFLHPTEGPHAFAAGGTVEGTEPVVHHAGVYELMPPMSVMDLFLHPSRVLHCVSLDADMSSWTLIRKFLAAISLPAVLAVHLSIPSPVTSLARWRAGGRALSVVAPLFGSGVVCLAAELGPLGWGVGYGVGLAGSVALAFATRGDVVPRWHSAFFATYAFGACVLWIYVCAAEVVAVAQSLGVAVGISQAALAVTALAWGNSLNDLVADTTVAHHGHISMALGAIYGGQMMNLVLGLGLSFVGAAWMRAPVDVRQSLCADHFFTMIVLSGSISCTTLLLSGPFAFSIPRWYAWPLLVTYAGYLCVIVGYESGQVRLDKVLPLGWSWSIDPAAGCGT
eukprot:TRINITY_DN12516_c0_g1_i1.p1 TRINITY_DN12516_c0_g1~~TRINITY_DN12516_c0_g1_i1.p1  ORF type:complete len:670 (+),score=110.92 TRINITY_DN12516_c0_g1_i1:144-2153(+)